MNLLWLLGVLLVFNRKVTGGFLEYVIDICFKPNEGLSGTVTEPITYKLFNKNIPEGVYISNENSTEYLKSLFIPGEDLKMVCHGWRESENSESSSSIVKAYMRTKDINVIAVDVKAIRGEKFHFSCKPYTNAVKAVKASGENVASMIDHILEIGLTSWDKVHLIGFSLGAHIMGVAGSSVSSGKIARVTGLDPAKTSSQPQDPSTHLDSTDAHFVDVIHTNTIFAGIEEAVGHVDFYPNYGAYQPGCPKASPTCSHYRAFELYSESIYSPQAFLSCRNSEMAYMGDGVTQTVSGIFYLTTNAQQPYGKFDYTIDCNDNY